MALTWHSCPSLEEDSAVVLFPIGRQVHFKGKLSLRVLSSTAKLKCLGAELKSSEGQHEDFHLFSPRGYSLLALTATTDDAIGQKDHALEEKLKALGFEATKVKTISDQAHKTSSAAVLLRRGPDSIGRRRLPRRALGNAVLFAKDQSQPREEQGVASLECVLDVNLFLDTDSPGPARLLQTLPEWETAVTSAEVTRREGKQAKLLMLGGKGVGKSTFSKYLINRLLSQHEAVLFVDLDPGQAEFTIPGCVSATVVSRPLLGPNFCSLDAGERVGCHFVGDVNVSEARKRFEDGVAALELVCRERAEPVWVINTMGFNRGLGVHLAQKVIQTFSPSTVVSIESGHNSKNYPANMLADVVRRGHTLRFPAVPERANTAMGNKDLWGAPEPKKLRDLVIATYFSEAGVVSVAWTDVFVQILPTCVATTHVLRALNCSIVALCSVSEKDMLSARSLANGLRLLPRSLSLGSCQAFAFVRGIDPDRKRIYLQTPTPAEELQGSLAVVMGALRTPDSMMAPQWPRAATDNQAGVDNPLSAPWQKSSRPKPGPLVQ